MNHLAFVLFLLPLFAQDPKQNDMTNCPMRASHQAVVQSHGDQAMGFPPLTRHATLENEPGWKLTSQLGTENASSRLDSVSNISHSRFSTLYVPAPGAVAIGLALLATRVPFAV